MKKAILFALASVMAINIAFTQGISINTTNAAADTSAILDVSSSNKGILIPRMTKAEKLLISTPANGLLVYQTNDTTGFWYFNSVKWVQAIGPVGATGATGAASTVAGPQELLAPLELLAPQELQALMERSLPGRG